METFAPVLEVGLELIWADPREMRMPMCSVVEGLNVVRNIFRCQCTILVDVFLDTLFFQTAEKGFRYRVDAPMSRTHQNRLQVGHNQRVQFPNQVALQTSLDFLTG